MSREGLLRDLKALHHGRGIRRAKVRSWLGPELADILGVAPHHADADVRVALARLLARHSQPLPRDLRHLFRLGVGLETDLPYLEDRLGEASEQYDRSTRVLRRRLRDAEILVADALLRERAPAGAWWDSQGWQWLGARQALVLRADAVLTLDYDVLALSPHQKHVTFRFTVPGLRLDEEIECTAVEGITLIASERTSATGWLLALELPQELQAGESIRTVIRVRVPRADALHSYVVLAPVRELPRCQVSIDFGASDAATSYWLLDGILPSDLGPSGTLPVGVDARPARGVVSHEFGRPRPGLAYGIGWLPVR